ncbi:MAG: AtpZ/AtpI family protein [Bacteroidales bacterium]|jgi:F0F1-type ATP synthase assembly protein I|nr:AtpZ/AtpI family protein [Bacteroidales bacterium]
MEEQDSQEEKKKKNQEEDKENSPLQTYARYSGMAFQMIAVILLATWIGIRIDKWLTLETPVFTLVFALLGVFGGIYLSVRDFIK